MMTFAFVVCPNCGGQLTKTKYFGVYSEYEVSRCISCGWYATAETSMLTSVSDVDRPFIAEVKHGDNKDRQQDNRGTV